ncbi:alpha-2,8-sialyltransferase 8B-like [Antedon mediterranea]|uniref:alpha-2,8-sialyltransferase 8B-like n=1 Tax=Antedon mediterranea TaxID=105859 RepID=UPI003AF44BB4
MMTTLCRRYMKCVAQQNTLKLSSRSLVVVFVAAFILVNMLLLHWMKFDNDENPSENEWNSFQRKMYRPDIRVHIDSELRRHIDVDKFETLRSIISSLGLSANQTIVPYDVNIDRRKNISRKATCAIVGSSGILTGSGCGYEIDQHQFVIRENLAKTDNFEYDVGNRTDLMTSNKALTQVLDHCLRGREIDCYLEYRDRLVALNNVYFLIITFRDWGNSDQKRFVKFIRRARNENLSLDIRIPNKPIKSIIKALWSLKNDTSSGLMIFTIATTFCDKISLYGFYPFDTSPTGERLRNHYYNYGSWKGVHDMKKEYRLYQKLHKEGIIRHVVGRCR